MQKRLLFPIFRIPPQQTSPPSKPSPPTVRRPWKGISAPFQCAESSRNIRFAKALVVVAPQAKTLQIPAAKKIIVYLTKATESAIRRV